MEHIHNPDSSFSLENLIETEDIGLDILHPGGLDITKELAELCHITDNSEVLDIACGTGESACYLMEQFGCRVTGLDISETLLEKARQKAERKNLEIDFHLGDAHLLPFRDNKFDAVISECTTCILDKERAIAEMVKVTNQQGYVGIHDICWGEKTPEKLKQNLADMEGERPETLTGWQKLFENAGLIDVQTIDKSQLLTDWIKDIRHQMGLQKEIKIFMNILKTWGWEGLRKALQSEKIFQSPYTGYGIIVGKKG